MAEAPAQVDAAAAVVGRVPAPGVAAVPAVLDPGPEGVVVVERCKRLVRRAAPQRAVPNLLLTQVQLGPAPAWEMVRVADVATPMLVPAEAETA